MSSVIIVIMLLILCWITATEVRSRLPRSPITIAGALSYLPGSGFVADLGIHPRRLDTSPSSLRCRAIRITSRFYCNDPLYWFSSSGSDRPGFASFWSTIEANGYRTKPFYLLARADDDFSEDTLISSYFSCDIFTATFHAFDRRHWAVFSSSTALLIIYAVLPPIIASTQVAGVSPSCTKHQSERLYRYLGLPSPYSMATARWLGLKSSLPSV